jgi:riboflavin biosynthesis pyrimidine reductase
VRRLHPAPIVELDDDQLRADYGFPASGTWIRANMVSTLDGVMRGPDGGSRSISTPADQRVFSIARRDADAVLVGAGTIRAEDYRPSVRTVAIVTARLGLPLSLRMFSERTEAHARPIALTTTRAADAASGELRRVIDIVPCGDTDVDLRAVIQALTDRGHRRIHCEGGPSLLSDLVAAGLLDELLLTMVPRLLGGGPGEHIVDIAGGLDPAWRMATEEILEEDGTVLLRARRVAC